MHGKQYFYKNHLSISVRSFLSVLACLALSVNCQWLHAQAVMIRYTENNADFPNPERGFYIPSQTYAGKFVPLNGPQLVEYRTVQQKHGSASYAIYSTLLFRYYILDKFVDQALDENFLKALENDFSVVRKAGLKMIIRFSYINKVHSDGCVDKEGICPPYGDASKTIVLKHISQLKPLLQRNADIIAVMQQGFIGIWGENYYTDSFGDASENGAGRILDSNWRDRNDVLKALLDALHKSRMVQVRTPQMKQKFVYGPSAGTDANSLTREKAYNNTDEARIGFHNDCFLASADDYGTYYDYGSSSARKKSASETMRKYFEADSRYGPVGGETCDDAFSPQNDCAPAGHAEQEMAAMHYSYLNTGYNNKVNNDWDSMGCLSSIKKRLGYRFVLKNALFPATAKAGGTFTFSVNLANRGYAAPFNPRAVELVLRNIETGKIFILPCKSDIRFWFSGDIHWKETVTLPGTITAGSYALMLNFPDPYPSLSKRPEYSIQLANEKVWEAATGYNKLNHIVIIRK